MFLAICNEALGLSPEQILDSDFVLLNSILREHNYISNQRNKQLNGEDANEDKEYAETIDYKTGKKRRVERVKNI